MPLKNLRSYRILLSTGPYFPHYWTLWQVFPNLSEGRFKDRGYLRRGIERKRDLCVVSLGHGQLIPWMADFSQGNLVQSVGR